MFFCRRRTVFQNTLVTINSIDAKGLAAQHNLKEKIDFSAEKGVSMTGKMVLGIALRRLVGLYKVAAAIDQLKGYRKPGRGGIVAMLRVAQNTINSSSFAIFFVF